MTTANRTFSPSQLRVYDHCPQEHHYSYTEGIQRTERTGKHFDFGNYAHELMHVYYNILKLGGHTAGSDFLIKAMESRVKNDLLQADFDNIELVSLVWPRLLVFFRHQSAQIDKGIEVLEVEKEFTTTVTTPHGHEVDLHGIIDLIYRDRSGTPRIRDHKTGANAKTHSSNSVMLDDQLGHYSVSNDIPDIEISFINSYLHKKKQPPIDSLFALHRYRHTPVGLSVIKLNILQKIDKILDTEPHKNYSPTCPNCQFFELCHAETRGTNVQRIKSLHFRTKEAHEPGSTRLSSQNSKTSEHTNDDSKFEVNFINL
jgi:predicted nucleic-acid-binding Zn-ribbon protein